MKKIRFLTCLLTAALVAAAFTGCGETSAKTVDVTNQQEQGQRAPQGERGTMAKVVSLNGDQLTVLLAVMPDRNNEAALPENGTPPAIGPGQPGQGGGVITFTGEQVTYTLSGNVTIEKGMGENAVEMDLSELTADDVIRFTTGTNDDGNEIITSIVVMD